MATSLRYSQEVHSHLSDKGLMKKLFKILLMAIAFAIYFVPKAYAIGQTAYNIWRVVSIAESVIIIILYLLRQKISLRWSMMMLFLFLYYCFSTYIASSDGSRPQLIFYFVEVGGFISLLEYGLATDKETCLKAFLVGSIVMCGWHYATFIMYRNYSMGMNFNLTSVYISGELTRHPYFLLTHDNGSIFYYLPLLCGVWYQVCEKQRGFSLALILSILVFGMYWSLFTVTAMVITAAIVITFLIIWKFDCIGLRFFLNYKRALAIGLIFCVFVVLFYSNDILSAIGSYFGKAEDLGRGRIWSRAIPLFLESPIVGNGFESDPTTTFKLGINHCHNIIVQVLYSGGLIAATVFGGFLVKCDLPENERTSPLTKGQAIICITIIATFIVATFDWYLYMPIQFFPFILFHYSSSGKASAVRS